MPLVVEAVVQKLAGHWQQVVRAVVDVVVRRLDAASVNTGGGGGGSSGHSGTGGAGGSGIVIVRYLT